jgi:hypothetical protein
MRMSKSTSGKGAAVRPRPQAWGNEPAVLVCAGLMLAVLALAIRIASVW